MKKIPNLFERDWNGDKSRVLPALNTAADVAWVLAGESAPTVKWDGSAVLVSGGKLFVRYDAKRGKTPPPGFEPCQEEDPVTGHRPGWIPAEGNSAAKWHLDAFVNSVFDSSTPLPDGTYEACGPQFQSNLYEFPRNILIRHGADVIRAEKSFIGSRGALQSVKQLPPYTGAAEAYDLLRVLLETYWYQHPEMPRARLIEGIVFHHLDGRMAKVLASDSWTGVETEGALSAEDVIGRGGPCIEAECTYVGMRKTCHECQYGGQHDERTRALLAEAALTGRRPDHVFYRCPQHAVEHQKEHHGIEPKELFCLRCKQSLGTWTNTTSPAGAPWCGSCRPWWHE